MPEPAGLLSAAAPVAALLTPVILLLLVALRVRKRVSYPHELLIPRQDRKPAAAFFRTLRMYLDAVVDAAAAIIIGFAIAGFPRPAPDRGTAVIVDASLSMLAGMHGDRALDEASRLIFTEEKLRNADLYVLGWDPASQSHTIRNASKILKDAVDPLYLASSLESYESFITVDYMMINGLRHGFPVSRGYEDIVLLTDNPSVQADGIETRLLSVKPPAYLYPAAAAWDEDWNRSVVRIAAAGSASLLALWKVADDGSLSKAKPEDYTITDNPAGFELSFPEAGLWAVAWYGHIIPFEAPGQPDPLYARGSFAQRIVAALGPIGSSIGQPRGSLTVRDGGGSGNSGYISISQVTDEEFVMPPAVTLGSVIAAGFDDAADFAMGRAALASMESAYPFWIARAKQKMPATGPAPSLAVTASRQKPVRVGDGFLYPDDGDSGVPFIVPPVTEYTQDGRRITIALQAPADRRFFVALILGCLYGLKLLVSYLVKK